jgi:DNA-binding winged helix-turn-helix (wHTH) protein
MAFETAILEPTSSAETAPFVPLDMVESIFSQAKSDYLLTQFSKALLGFRRVLHSTESEPHSRWRVESLILMSRIFLEQEKGEELRLCVRQLQELQARPDLPAWIHAKIFYILGVLTYAEAGGMSKALQLFRKSIDLCVVIEDREVLAYAMYGVANVFYGLNEYDRVLEELDKLDQILQFHSVPDVHVFSFILRAFIARNRGLTQNALALTRQACEHLRVHPNLYLYLQTLYTLGSTYLKMDDLHSAQIYLELGKISCSPHELPRTYRVLENALQECRKEAASSTAPCELHFNTSSGWLERKGMGKISLNGQFVLRDLLTLFFENPGTVFSKEDLVRKIWSEEYSPELHDNKIYVTLKRLRQALQPLFPDVDSILRARNGYSFNHRLFTFTLTGSESPS